MTGNHPFPGREVFRKPVGGKVRSSEGEVPRLPPYKYHPDYERYKASRNHVTKELRKARKVFEEKLAQEVKDLFIGTSAVERSQKISLAH